MIGYLLALLRRAKLWPEPAPPPTRQELARLAADAFATKDVMEFAAAAAELAREREPEDPARMIEAEIRLYRAQHAFKAANSRYLAAVREYTTALVDGRINPPENQP